MSDLADRCEASVCEVAGAGGSFSPVRPASGLRGNLSARNLMSCSCGGKPSFFPAGRAEVLRCGRCGNTVGPLASRQTLGEDWNAWGRCNGRPT